MTLTKVLRTTGLAKRATVHGFRSSFRVWASECTEADHAVMELSLAHAVGSAVEQAYARSDLVAKRRELMQRWAKFLIGRDCREAHRGAASGLIALLAGHLTRLVLQRQRTRQHNQRVRAVTVMARRRARRCGGSCMRRGCRC